MFKSGFIAIAGRPNVGKSTLLNRILGEKLAITSSKPQTTRNRITGIRNTDDGQMIFLDTPGIHRAKTPLNRYMVKAATSTFSEVDLVLLLVEADRGHDADDDLILESLREVAIPVFLVINKIDLVAKPALLPLIDRFRGLYDFREIVPVSAETGDGIQRLLELIQGVLPEGPKLFSDDMFTDNSERFIAAEIIREKILLLTHREIPYATAVTIDSFKEDEEKNFIRITATITAEKDSQKGILIGKGGKMLKEIGTQARIEMEQFFAAKIFLELFVRMRKDWTKDAKWLKEFGYGD
ncbi:MAG TPA: GTPase Era [Syntrophales bacterium]|nr:GTPase Era [Syntrophales bacterium]